jgi:hypothetical protein
MMQKPMDALLEEVSRDHFPHPPATPEQLAEFERRVGWTLDPDLRAFYLHCDGAALIDREDPPYRILPLAEIVRARVAIFGKDEDSLGPATQYALCDLQDGNYVMVDVSRQEDGRYPLMDGDHEAWPDSHYCGQFARSFSEFLENVLRTREPLYWLEAAGERAE